MKPETGKTEQAAPADKVENTTSLPDDVFETVRRMARENAQKGDYMDDAYGEYINSYKEKHISPDRTKLMCMLNPLTMLHGFTQEPQTITIPGFPGYSAKLSVGAAFGAYLSVSDQNGEEVLSYTPPPNAGWMPHQTKAEEKFYDETTAVYSEVYSQTRAEMKEQGQLGRTMGQGINVKA